MRDRWADVTIGDVITLQRGFDITRDVQRDGSVPIVSSSGVSSFHDAAMCTGPGVVIGRKGTLGRVFYLDEPYWPHDTTLWVKDFKGNHERFVYYFLTHIDLTGFDVGSANPTLNRNHVHPIPIRWPIDIGTQRAISEVLGALDDKIAISRAIARSAHELAHSVFAAIPRQQTDETRLGEVLTLEYGRALPAARRVDGPVAVVGSGGVVGSHDTTWLPAPGVVVGRKGSVGATHWLDSPYFPIDTTYHVRPRTESIPLIFCYHLLRTIDFVGLNSDSAVPGLNRSEAYAVPVRLPHQDQLDAASRRAEQLFALARAHGNETAHLVNLRDTLLPHLVSGRLRVKGAGSAGRGVLRQGAGCGGPQEAFGRSHRGQDR